MSFTLRQGRAPLLISFPHSGTAVPSEVSARFTPTAQALPDTDWHVPALYDMADDLGAWTLEAHYSRYVIDVNRDPAGTSLYPGQSTTTLCPLDTFAGDPIYAHNPPDADDIAHRKASVFEPYHHALASTLDRIRETHGFALLWDAHSIRSVVPRFFEGSLPALNLGTANGASCHPLLSGAVAEVLAASDFDSVVNGRFVGGYITRHYGRPDDRIHAVQMEIAQSAYMDESGSLALQPLKQRALSAVLARALDAYLREAKKI
ncbi:MAG: N-formylglutamate deformylase [Pseudomonadota bacterium]